MTRGQRSAMPMAVQGLTVAGILAAMVATSHAAGEYRIGVLLNSTEQLDPLVTMNIATVPEVPGYTYTCRDTIEPSLLEPNVTKKNGNWLGVCDEPNQVNMTSLDIYNLTREANNSIPFTISNLFALRSLKMANIGLNGSLPISLGYMGFMQDLNISHNRLMDTVPATLFILTDLTSLDMYSNRLSGPISTAVGNLAKLSHFEIGANYFNGTILGNLAKLSNLQHIGISGTAANSSQLPPAAIQQFTMPPITTGFTENLGQVGSMFTNLLSLTHLDLSNNPNIVGNLSDFPWKTWQENSTNQSYPLLSYLNIDNTDIGGPFPEQAVKSVLLTTVIVDADKLKALCSFNDSGPMRFAQWNETVICTQTCPGGCAAPTTSNIGLVIGCVVGVAVFVMAVLVGAYYFLRARRFNDGVEVHGVRRFTLPELAEATDDYSIILGKGGFGEVYKGTVSMEDGKGKEVAVKKTKAERKKNMKKFDSGFRNEILVLSGVRHRNLVELCGYSSKGADVLLVYEFIVQGSVDDLLRLEMTDEGEGEANLTWERRIKIAFGAAQGLDYLHSGVTPPIIHRDIKSSNILVDGDFLAKVADFGLSKIRPEMDLDGGKTMGVQGTLGYIDPEYAATLKPTERSDVYSFGVVLLELATGWRPIGGPEKKHIIQRVAKGVNSSGFDSILAPSIRKELEDAEYGQGGQATTAVIYTGDSADGQAAAEVTIAAYSTELFQRFVKLGMQCCAKDSSTRPSMRTVAKALGEMIEGKTEDSADTIQEERFDEDGGEEVVLLTHNLGGEVGATVAFVMETQVLR